MARVIAVCNQKGGVGKTTTAINLAAGLGRRAGRVLLADIDPQGHATLGLGCDRTTLAASVYEAFSEPERTREFILADKSENLDLLPAAISLAGAEVELVGMEGRERRLATALASVESGYSHVVIDCPPSLGLLTLNGLVAANGVLVPVQAEYLALEGMSRLLDTIHLVRQGPNPGLEVEGVLVTMFSGRLNLCQQVLAEVRSFFREQVFDTVVPRSVRLAEAPSFGKTVFDYDGQSSGALAYFALAEEVLNRRRTEKPQMKTDESRQDAVQNAECKVQNAESPTPDSGPRMPDDRSVT